MDDLGDSSEQRMAGEGDAPAVDGLEEARVRSVLAARMLGDDAPVKIGRFVVIARVGSGGMGIVYSAFDPQLDRKVAIKLLIEGGAHEVEHARLLVEAKAMAKVAHPNVVNVFEVGEHDGRIYVALEYVDGRTLTKWNAERPRSWPESLAMVMQAGRGLASAHAAGVVHRDFKPDNVLVGIDERARVVDFGLAYSGSLESVASQDDTTDEAPLTRLTRTGTRLGTPAYMSPEQIRGEPADLHSDQFSFCVTAWEVLSGERPFRGRSTREVFDAVADGRVRKPPRGRIPAELEAVLRRGLAGERARRFVSMDALLDALLRAVQRRRRTRATVLLGGVAIVGLLAWGIDRRMRESAHAEVVAGCDAASAELDAVWNAEVRGEVRDALLATGMPHAQTTVEKLMPWLDERSAAWKDARREACMDFEVHHRSDADAFDRASWCLDERRLQFESLVGELRHADGPTLNRAIPAAAGLPQIAPCRDRSLLARLPLPPPEQRSRVAEVRGGLARSAALLSANKPDAALTLAHAVLVDAEAAMWPPLVGAAHFRIGVTLDRLGEAAKAEESLLAAYFEAGRGGAFDVMADAATYLVFVVGDRLRRTNDAELWSRHARLALQSLGDTEGLREAALSHVEGLSSNRAGRLQEAVVILERAVAIRTRLLGAEHPDVAGSLNNLSIAQLALGDFDAAQATIERSIAIKEAALGPEHPDVAISLGNLADLLHDRGEITKSRDLHARVLAMRERIFGPDHPDVALALNNLANDHQRLRDYAVARAHLERAIAIWEKSRGADHPDVSLALMNLGRLHTSTGNHADAKRVLERALAILEAAPVQDTRGIGIVVSNLADAEQGLGNLDRAAELHQRALQAFEKALGPDHPDVAFAYIGLGRVAVAQRRFEPAIEALEAAVRLRSAGANASYLADARLLLAYALYEARIDAPRATALATQARDVFRDAGDRQQDLVDAEKVLADLAAVGHVRRERSP